MPHEPDIEPGEPDLADESRRHRCPFLEAVALPSAATRLRPAREAQDPRDVPETRSRFRALPHRQHRASTHEPKHPVRVEGADQQAGWVIIGPEMGCQ